MEILSQIDSFYVSSPLYFVGISFILSREVNQGFKQTHKLIRLLAPLAILCLMLYKGHQTTANKPNYMKLFSTPSTFDAATFRSGYRRRAKQLHPDTSTEDTRDEFRELQEVYTRINNYPNQTKIWSLHVRFGDELNIMSNEAISREHNEYFSTIMFAVKSLMNYVMILLISFLFYSGTAKRGFFTQSFLWIISLLILLIKLVICLDYDVDEESGAFKLKESLQLSYCTNAELSFFFDCLLGSLLVFVYNFTVLLFPTDLQLMFRGLTALAKGYNGVGRFYREKLDVLKKERSAELEGLPEPEKQKVLEKWAVEVVGEGVDQEVKDQKLEGLKKLFKKARKGLRVVRKAVGVEQKKSIVEKLFKWVQNLLLIAYIGYRLYLKYQGQADEFIRNYLWSGW